MAKIIKEEDKIVKSVEKKQIGKLSIVFQSEDMNKVVEKINEIIEKIND